MLQIIDISKIIVKLSTKLLLFIIGALIADMWLVALPTFYRPVTQTLAASFEFSTYFTNMLRSFVYSHFSIDRSFDHVLVI